MPAYHPIGLTPAAQGGRDAPANGACRAKQGNFGHIGFPFGNGLGRQRAIRETAVWRTRNRKKIA
ncbi:hypothetical protein Rmet_6759 (plasmid) [Cupriavidus metallidurans CH34]|uniref:Uncharacterized protein n=1 Tax=Cupriavidus metallidurans (strain ATCC 43123 / DSM 2839 / NBRC 102507 / CH34) TaxID=266264 RepID=D3DYG8_CUPMC|nr:hypothetical protein Rmet_6759 [Cupriavidus metallidurans CH34]